MEQHPVPQQISSYQFRLVGDMTLKQFFQVAAGVIIALLIYSTGLWGIIKWPLIIFSVLVGAAFAFLPYKDRPLTAWVVSFFRAIYSTTEFRWKKYDKQPAYFTSEDATTQTQTTLDQTQVIKPTVAPKEVKPSFMQNLESSEKDFLSNVNQLLKGTPPPSVAQSLNTQTPLNIHKQVGQITDINVETQPEEKKSIYYKPPPTVKVPSTKPPSVVYREQEDQTTKSQQQPNIPTGVGQVSSTSVSQQTYMPQFSINAASPMPPDKVNTVVGQVMDVDGKIIEGAILEIKDDVGRPVRALKTNKLGHFIIVTPLQNGPYRLTTEKQGYSFDEISIDARGDLIPPMAIKAKNKFNPEQKPIVYPLQISK